MTTEKIFKSKIKSFIINVVVVVILVVVVVIIIRSIR